MSKAACPRRKSSATDAWDKQWHEHWSKVGTPDGIRKWGLFMMQQGVFAQDDIGFGRVTDSPCEAVDLIVRSLPPEVKAKWKPLT